LGDKFDKYKVSRTGVLVRIGGCLVDWTSHKQRNTETTTRDTEYIAAGDALKMIHVINYIQDTYETLSARQRPTPELFTDNEVMLKQLHKGNLPQVQRLAQFKMPVVTRSYRDGTTIFHKVYTRVNPADLLTKPTDRTTFYRLAGMMVCNIKIVDT
jgi:hypothetical protein